MKQKIYFRADGHSKMGLGHVFRSLALLEMVRNEFDCTFIIRKPEAYLKDQILNYCKNIIELTDTNENTSEAQYLVNQVLSARDIIVLDGYHFKTDYQSILKENDIKIACIDDIYAYHFLADVVINHAGGLSSQHYSVETYTQFYLGLSYALLRKPFREAALIKEKNREIGSIFICLGGADPNNDTLAVLKKCEKLDQIKHCYLVIGGAYQYKETLKEYLKQSSLSVTLLSNLSADEMVFYMKKCPQAIIPPSTISFEYSSVGGVVYLKTIADNQLSIRKYFIEQGMAFDFNDMGNIPLYQQEKALQLQAAIFDGQQQDRYLRLFRNLANQ